MTKAEIAARLKAGYPGGVAGVEGNDVVFTDGTRLPFDDGQGSKSFEAWLAAPDIEDMFRAPYPPTGAAARQPADDPGRARNAAFFRRIYGDCRKGEVAKHLVAIPWLPGKSRQKVMVTSHNGVAEKLKAVATDLARLPARFHVDLMPSAGAYKCRNIAGTNLPSAHGYGIAIDIALKHADYWRWRKGSDATAYRNSIPIEIVEIFERRGFIWGGRWRHYDTMHFEYRPELAPPR